MRELSYIVESMMHLVHHGLKCNTLPKVNPDIQETCSSNSLTFHAEAIITGSLRVNLVQLTPSEPSVAHAANLSGVVHTHLVRRYTITNYIPLTVTKLYA